MRRWTEKDIQKIIMREYTHDLVIANYTPNKWHECDVMRITKSGYSTEYEIKLSSSDFSRDKHKHWGLKHENLLKGSENAPNSFYFVVPEGLITPDRIPSFAGLIYVNNGGYMSTIIKAPKLHKVKWDDEKIKRLCNTYKWRYLNYFLKN